MSISPVNAHALPSSFESEVVLDPQLRLALLIDEHQDKVIENERSALLAAREERRRALEAPWQSLAPAVRAHPGAADAAPRTTATRRRAATLLARPQGAPVRER